MVAGERGGLCMFLEELSFSAVTAEGVVGRSLGRGWEGSLYGAAAGHLSAKISG